MKTMNRLLNMAPKGVKLPPPTSLCDNNIRRNSLGSCRPALLHQAYAFCGRASLCLALAVLTTDTPMAHVVVRAHKWMPNYLRTLPLHDSQRELESTPDYTDFSYDIRPTSDFLGELLRHSDGIEVLQPLDLREKMRQMIAEMLKRY